MASAEDNECSFHSSTWRHSPGGLLTPVATSLPALGACTAPPKPFSTKQRWSCQLLLKNLFWPTSYQGKDNTHTLGSLPLIVRLGPRVWQAGKAAGRANRCLLETRAGDVERAGLVVSAGRGRGGPRELQLQPARSQGLLKTSPQFSYRKNGGCTAYFIGALSGEFM